MKEHCSIDIAKDVQFAGSKDVFKAVVVKVRVDPLAIMAAFTPQNLVQTNLCAWKVLKHSMP